VLGQLRDWIIGGRFSARGLPAAFYVVGHERSGTHFLINTLSRNAVLRPGDHSAGEWTGPYISGLPGEFAHIEALRADWRAITAQVSIIKTHSDRERFESGYPKAKVVYVLRDPRDTLVSFYYYFIQQADKIVRSSDGRESATLSEFLRRPLTPNLRWANSRHDAGRNVAERWANHVRGWLGAGDTVVVRYEDLKTDFRLVLERLAPFLGFRLLPVQSPVALHDAFSVLPRKGVIGDWRNHFTAEDESFVRDAVERAGVDWEAVTWRQ
jgi:hypothetical protein